MLLQPAATCWSAAAAAAAAAADALTEEGPARPSAAVSKPHRPKRVECVVCLDARAEVMLLPCKHTILCQACAELVRAGGKPCPMCRTEVDGEVLVAWRMGRGGGQGARVGPNYAVGASAAAAERNVLVAVGGGGPRRIAVPAFPTAAQLSGSSRSTAASVAPTAAAAVIIADLPVQQQPAAAQNSSSSSSGNLDISAAAGPSGSSGRVVPLPLQDERVTTAKRSSSNAEMQQIAGPSVGARAAETPTAGTLGVQQQNGDFMHEMSSLLGEAEDHANAVLDQTQE